MSGEDDIPDSISTEGVKKTTDLSEEQSSKARIEYLRNFLKTQCPQADEIEKVDNLDLLLMSQLKENIELVDSHDFLTAFEGKTVYGLPCEVREIKGEYYLFIPRVKNWYFRRNLPIPGNHSPFAETYAIPKQHKFKEAFERIVGERLDEFIENNQPITIGGETDLNKTPYHRFYLTDKDFTLELQAKPTIAQLVKLERLKDRLSSTMPVNIVVNEKGRVRRLPRSSEAATIAELPRFWLDLKVNYLQFDHAHDVVSDTQGNLNFSNLKREVRPGVIYGFGYMPNQLDDTEGDSSISFYFDINSRKHSETKAGFVLEEIAWRITSKDKGLSKINARSQLESQLTSDNRRKLPEWHHRPEIINNNLPFILRVGGYDIRCGIRAMMNFYTSTLTVEFLTDSSTYKNGAKETLLKRAADKVAKDLADLVQEESEYMQTRGVIEYPLNNVQVMSGVYPVWE